jgi:hypothetical protein
MHRHLADADKIGCSRGCRGSMYSCSRGVVAIATALLIKGVLVGAAVSIGRFILANAV